jgi:3-oxoacyl-[acyl-carrier protein] reductase
MYEDNKTAIVTGAARGIGKKIAIGLAKQGINVVVSDVMKDEAEKTSKEIIELGVKSIVIIADVSKIDDATRLIKETVEQFGAVDFLVNNAGITRDNLSVRMSEQEWDMVIDINLKGTFLC